MSPTLTSLAPDVWDYLVAQCQASPVLGLAMVPVGVFDGPAVSPDQVASFAQRLWIGHDPFSGPSQAGMEADQVFAHLDHARTREETGHITCAVEDYSGDPDMRVHRAAVKSLLGTVELLLRGDPATGGPGDASLGGLVMWAEVGGPFAWYPAQLDNGASMACVFRIAYEARLTT